MFPTSKCHPQGRLVHAVLWYFFHACTSLPGDEHLEVRNISKTL